MSASLSIKDVPDDLVQRLRERARRNHRSLQGELMAILEQTLNPGPLTIDEVHKRIAALDFSTPPDSVEMIRQDRDAR